MKIQKVGIVGCGQMGGGIAQVCAQAGYTILVSESTRELLQKGLAGIAASLERSVKKQNITSQEKDAVLARITGTTDAADFHECDLVIEAVSEVLDLKKRLFTQLDRICPAHALLATNTSSLSVADIASATGRPDKVLGLHFFNPVPSLKLMEIVTAPTTSQATMQAGKGFAKTLGKTAVIVQDSPGFIVNRLMAPQILNAIRLVESGVAAKEDIDTAMMLGLNHPIGPLALADLIGLDTLLTIADSIYDKLGDSQYAAPETLKKLVAAGHLGRKTGSGFYEYL
ncbi:MAG: 3-hydroxybutyryl-CoA dehydrogenase [Dehalococcoidales bacterium]